MIFNTLKSDASQNTEHKKQYIEVKISIPRYVLEKAIRDVLNNS